MKITLLYRAQTNFLGDKGTKMTRLDLQVATENETSPMQIVTITVPDKEAQAFTLGEDITFVTESK